MVVEGGVARLLPYSCASPVREILTGYLEGLGLGELVEPYILGSFWWGSGW